MNIYILSQVRIASETYRKKIENYAYSLEQTGYDVYLPQRDTDQNATGLAICKQNRRAILNADEVHIFYSGNSQGTHFDMGIAFGANKRIKIIENEEYDDGKSFPRMLEEWNKEGGQ